MKPSRILLFIFAVFAMLGAVSATVPEEGWQIEGLTVKFPTINEFFHKEAQGKITAVQVYLDAQSIKENIAMRRMSEEMTIRHRAVSNQVSINFPDNDPSWMDEIFTALKNSKEHPVRIIHYGDSQIEEDRISSGLRQMLQEKFGGSGVGLVPANQAVATSAIGQSSEGGERSLVFGPEAMRLDDGHYGVLGQTTYLNGSMTINFYQINLKYTHDRTKTFSRISIMAEDIENAIDININIGGQSIKRTMASGDCFAEIDVPESSRATITLTGTGKIHGIALDGETGVSLDNAAMRGCSGTVITKIARQSLAKYYDHYSVPLIIMQYGGNTVPYIKGEKSLSNYCRQLTSQIKYLQNISPDSKILFIGPSDMSTKINGKMETYPFLPMIVDSLREMCNRNNVAYWDLFKAMGGKNSMASWVNATPQLAGADYIHFTRTGAEHTSTLIYQAFMLAYDYYTYRNSSLQEADTTAITHNDIYIPQDSSIFEPIKTDSAYIAKDASDSLSELNN